MYLTTDDFNYISNKSNLDREFPVLDLVVADREVLVLSEKGSTMINPAYKRSVTNSNGGAGDVVVDISDDMMDTDNPELKAIQEDGEILETSYDDGEVTITFTDDLDGTLYYKAGKGRIKIVAEIPSVEGGGKKVLYSGDMQVLNVTKDIDFTKTLLMEGFKLKVIVDSPREIVFSKVGSISIECESVELRDLLESMGITEDTLLNSIKKDFVGL